MEQNKWKIFSKLFRSSHFELEKEPFICGDIQLGEAQKIRFSLNQDNFFDRYAPELKKGLSVARNYSFTVTRLD